MCEFIIIPSIVTNTVMYTMRSCFVFSVDEICFLTLIIAGFKLKYPFKKLRKTVKQSLT